MGQVGSQEPEAIPWNPERKLVWTDFKGRPFKTAWAAAITASGISYSFTSFQENGQLVLDITINSYFYPEESWYQPKLCDSFILSHEQLHFDIAELYARKMRKRVAETTFTNDVKAEVKELYKDILRELGDFQKKYDFETNFSRNVQKQLEWNKEIEKALIEQ
jgi:hypothetical protein